MIVDLINPESNASISPSPFTSPKTTTSNIVIFFPSALLSIATTEPVAIFVSDLFSFTVTSYLSKETIVLTKSVSNVSGLFTYTYPFETV